MLIDADGNFWLGEEFGPPNTRALGANPLVQTCNNRYLAAGQRQPAELGWGGKHDHQTSHTRIYTLFERELSTDTDSQRRLPRHQLRLARAMPAPATSRPPPPLNTP